MSQTITTSSYSQISDTTEQENTLSLIEIEENHLSKQNGVKLNITQDVLDSVISLMDDKTKICIIMAAGLSGTGKSTMLNSIARYLDNSLKKEDYFYTSGGCFSATRGIRIINKKLYYKEMQIILVDCEGQDGIYDYEEKTKIRPEQLENYFNQLFALSFCIPQVLLIHSQQRLHNFQMNQLTQFGKIFQKIKKIKQFQIPMMRWNIINGDDSNNLEEQKIDIMNQNEYTKILFECLQMINLPEYNEQIDILDDKLLKDLIESMLNQISSSNIQQSKSQIEERLNDLALSISSGEIEGLISQRIQSKEALNNWKNKPQQIEYNKFMNCYEYHLEQKTQSSIFNGEFQVLCTQLEQTIEHFLNEQDISITHIFESTKQQILEIMRVQEFPIMFVEAIEKSNREKQKKEQDKDISNLEDNFDKMQSDSQIFDKKIEDLKQKQKNNLQKMDEQSKLYELEQQQSQIKYSQYQQEQENILNKQMSDFLASILRKQHESEDLIKKKFEEEENKLKQRNMIIRLEEQRKIKEEDINQGKKVERYQEKKIKSEKMNQERMEREMQNKLKEDEVMKQQEHIQQQIQEKRQEKYQQDNTSAIGLLVKVVFNSISYIISPFQFLREIK